MSICETLQFSRRIHIGGNPQNILKISNFWQESSARKINVHHIKGIYVMDVCALCSIICYHDQTCIQKRCHEKSKKNTVLWIELCGVFTHSDEAPETSNQQKRLMVFQYWSFIHQASRLIWTPNLSDQCIIVELGEAHHPQYGRLQIIFAARLFLNVILRFSELPTVHTSVCYTY